MKQKLKIQTNTAFNQMLSIEHFQSNTFNQRFQSKEIGSYVDIQYWSNTFNLFFWSNSNAFNHWMLSIIKRFQSNERMLSIKWMLQIKCCFQLNAFNQTLSIKRFQSNTFNQTLSIKRFPYILDVRTIGNFFHCVAIGHGLKAKCMATFCQNWSIFYIGISFGALKAEIEMNQCLFGHW